MPKIFTPARLAAALGVVTGLGTAATALTGVLPVGGVSAVVLAAAGVLAQAGVLIKFLEGQAGWEQSPVGQAQHAGPINGVPGEPAPPEVAVLVNDEPLIEGEPEPDRLTAQL